jgi:hypothetical protein
LAHLYDDNQAQLPEVEKTLYAATDEALKEYEATGTPLSTTQWPTLPAELSCRPSKYATFINLTDLARSPDSNSFQYNTPYALLTP